MAPHSSIAETPQHARAMSLGRSMLVWLLAARAANNAFFAAWLWATTPYRAEFFNGAATYLAVDGILGLLAAGVLLFDVLGEAPRLLTIATAVEGGIRLAAGVALWAFPGLPDFPVTAVAFFGVAGSYAACLALAAFTVRVAVWRSRHHAHERTPLAIHEQLDPVFFAGVFALVLIGHALASGPPTTSAEYRSVGMLWGSVAAGAFLVAALGVRGSVRPVD